MDIVETCPGNTVYLPVFVPGGFLYLGDAHAAMGHGELSATGLEMPPRRRSPSTCSRRRRLPGPRIESPDRDHDRRQRLPDGARRSPRPTPG